MAWLTLAAVAERLACSPSHVRALARAAELADQPPKPGISPRSKTRYAVERDGRRRRLASVSMERG